MRHATRARAAAAATFAVLLVACGETRRPIGEECIRGDDCLSGTCAARTCAPSPDLVTGTGDEGPDAGPRLAPGARDGGDGG